MTHFLTVSRHTVLDGVDRDSVHGQLVSCSEDTNGDFLRRIYRGLYRIREIDMTDGEMVLTPRLATRILVKGPA